MDKEIAITWMLYAIRETLGLSVVRNTILQNKIKKTGKYKNDIIYYGDTFTTGNTFNYIYQLFEKFEGCDKQILIFTANGEIHKNRLKRHKELKESHYVSFIVEKLKSTVTIIDPSRKNGNIGIYNPYIGICLTPFLKKKDTEFIGLKCQILVKLNIMMFFVNHGLYILYICIY
jgi:hypothetical protein